MKKTAFMLNSFVNLILKKRKILYFYDIGMNSYNEIELIRWALKEGLDRKYKIVLFTNMRELAQKLFPENVRILSGGVSAYFYQMTAKYIFVEQNGYRWICKNNKRQTVVQLWHGVPIKKVGNKNNRQNYYIYNEVYTKVLAPSEYCWKIMQECFDYTDDRKLICPYPRAEALKRSDFIRKNKFDYEKIILWMPTYRTAYFEHGKKAKIEFPILSDKNIGILDEFLREKGWCLIIKPHVLQQKLAFFKKKYSNIRVLNNTQLYEKEILLYELIGASDCLISDYSSVVFEYLLTGNPMIFTKDDYSDYKERRGFLDETVFENLPGEKVESLEQLIEKLTNVFEKDAYGEQRRNLCKWMNLSTEENYCERIFRQIGLLEWKK